MHLILIRHISITSLRPLIRVSGLFLYPINNISLFTLYK